MNKQLFVFLPILLLFGSRLDAQILDGPIPYKHDKPGLRFIYLPSSLILGGIVLNGNGAESIKSEIVEERNALIPKFKTHADDFLQFSPIVMAYGLDALGYRSRNDLANKSIILLKGELFMTGVVFGLKNATHQLRPDQSAYNSFPSGHTAQAFAAATFLSEEYKGRYKWMPYVAYGIASSVGVLRMANNKHYISDVLAGAGIGILSMKLAYATHRYKWGKKPKPTPHF